MQFINQSGQIAIVLLLTMLVALSIGLVVTQRSVTDVTTSTQSEQASRAFSAAEAGIERAISQGTTGLLQLPENDSQADVSFTPVAMSGSDAFEFPAIFRDEIAQFWLADPNSALNPPAQVYPPGSNFFIHFGEQSANPAPALEVTVVTFNTNFNTYNNSRYYFDPDGSRRSNNNFSSCTTGVSVTTTLSDGTSKQFRCRATIPAAGSGSRPIMARARILYSNNAQPLALQPAGGANFPDQGRIYTSVGRAGESEQRLEVFQQTGVAPSMFDYVLFSGSNITKD